MAEIVKVDGGVPAELRHTPELVKAYGYAHIAVTSGFTKAKRISEALFIIARGQTLGLSPIESLEGIHVIEGRTTMSAQLMLALMKRGGLRIVDESLHNQHATVSVYERDTVTSEWVFLGKSSFTVEDAKAADLLGKQNWKKHLNAMLWARCISAAFRKFAPQMGLGLYTQDEIESIPNEPIRTSASGNTSPYYDPQPDPASEGDYVPDGDVIDAEVLSDGAADEVSGFNSNEPAEPIATTQVVEDFVEGKGETAAPEPEPPKPKRSRVKATPETQTPPPTASTEPTFKVLNVMLAEGGKSYITCELMSTLDGEVKKYWASNPKVIGVLDAAFGDGKLIRATFNRHQITEASVV